MTSRGAYKPRRVVKVPQTMGQRIQAARRAFGMTQQDLSDALHVPQQSVSSWERDKSEPSGPGMSNLVRLFGIPEEAFRDGKSFELPDAPCSGLRFGGDIMAAEDGTKKILTLPAAHPGKAWSVVVGTDQRDPLTKEQALDLVAKTFDGGDALWVVVKPGSENRTIRDQVKRRPKKV